jgi:hypothetical protein
VSFPETFEAFLVEQELSGQALSPELEAILREDYERAKRAAMERNPRTLFRAPCRKGEYRYGVAIEDGDDLWLTLVVQRSKSGYYVLIPRVSSSDPHASWPERSCGQRATSW